MENFVNKGTPLQGSAADLTACFSGDIFNLDLCYKPAVAASVQLLKPVIH